MTTTGYQGKAANASLLPARNIASSTDATPIEVTTSVAHGYLTGERISIRGHAVNVNANGLWTIAVTGPTTFTLTGTVGSGAGAGGATGRSIAFAPRPAMAIPDDDELPAMATFTPSLEQLADQGASFSERVGNNGIEWIGSAIIADDAAWSTVLWSTDATGAADTWTENRKNGAGTAGHGFTELAATVVADVGRDPAEREWLDIHFSSIVSAFAANTDFSLFLLIADYGVAPTFAAATRIAGSRVRLPSGYFGPLTLRGRRFISGLTRGKYAQVYLGAKSSAGGDGYTLQGDAQILITQYRTGAVIP